MMMFADLPIDLGARQSSHSGAGLKPQGLGLLRAPNKKVSLIHESISSPAANMRQYITSARKISAKFL